MNGKNMSKQTKIVIALIAVVVALIVVAVVLSLIKSGDSPENKKSGEISEVTKEEDPYTEEGDIEIDFNSLL